MIIIINSRGLNSKNKPTFMSSTNEGNPPIAMKVKNAATNMSMDPLACNFVVEYLSACMFVDNQLETNIYNVYFPHKLINPSIPTESRIYLD